MVRWWSVSGQHVVDIVAGRQRRRGTIFMVGVWSVEVERGARARSMHKQLG